MKVIDAEIAIREALCEGGERFKELGLSAEGYVLFCDAKYMQCAPEESKYMTAVLALKKVGSKETNLAVDEELVTDAEDEEEDGHVYELDFGFDVKNGEITDSDVESAILTFLEDCDELKEKLEDAEDIGAMLDELRGADEEQYVELLKKLKKIRIGFFIAAGVMALVIILAILL